MVTQQEYKQRREKLMQQMGSNSIAIICTNPEYTRTQDTPFLFRPDGNFYYLTGFAEPEAVAILIPGNKDGEFILFNRPHDPTKEIWHGYHEGQTGAVQNLGADAAFPIEDLSLIVPDFLKNKEKIFYQFSFVNGIDTDIVAWQNELHQQVRTGVSTTNAPINVTDLINEMRLIKSEAEITLLREAATINIEAHKHAMQSCVSGMTEIQLSAELNYIYGRYNCLEMAYPPVVASGANACTLHYLASKNKLHDAELVLIDMGEEYQHYTSDITRTFPVNGKFSPAQKAIYELVLHTQLTILKAIKPGIAFDELQTLTIHSITAGLVKLGILQGNIDKLIVEKAYFDFYMHNVSHWMGLDVHDVSTYKINNNWRNLEVGMVLTVEPGIYIHANNKNVNKKWRGIGIRIEDDVVVTANGCENLTVAAPKTVHEIEAIMAKRK